MATHRYVKVALSCATLGALSLLGACADTGTTDPTTRDLAPKAIASHTVLLPTPSSIVAGPDAGYFGHTINANESLRLTTEFWDNVSSDNSGAAHCDVGYFASGTMVSGCLNETPGSTANQGGYTYMWGDDGPPAGNGYDASSFMFNGTLQYNVTLIASYTISHQEIGWFTKSGTTYTFHPVAGWSARTLSTTITVPAGASWGFYINTLVPQDQGCGGATHPNFACSDATGGFTAAPNQHFALFSNSTGTKFLVGAEDNVLKLLGDLPNPDFHDSDYNDYIFSIEPACASGLTIGYWKNHLDNWSGYSPTTTIGSVFNNTGTASSSSFLDALSFKGGPTVQDAKNLLLKQAVAALLNASSSSLNYPLTTSQIIAEVNTALASGDRATILAEATRLDNFNNLELSLCTNTIS